jgi:hypothetical protein
MRGKEYNSHIFFSIKKRTELQIGKNVDLNIDKVLGEGWEVTQYRD